MTELTALLKTESFTRMAVTVVFWAALYLLIKLFTIRAGADDLLRMGTKKIIKLKKLTRQFRILCTARGAHKNVSRAVKLLPKVLKAEKKATRLLVMYLFDDRDDLDVAAAKDLVVKIPDYCRYAIVTVADKKDESLVPLFDGAEAELKQAIALLKKAAAIDKKKELLQIND